MVIIVIHQWLYNGNTMGISWGYNGKMGISWEESGGFHSHGGTPIAGLFKRGNPI